MEESASHPPTSTRGSAASYLGLKFMIQVILDMDYNHFKCKLRWYQRFSRAITGTLVTRSRFGIWVSYDEKLMFPDLIKEYSGDV